MVIHPSLARNFLDDIKGGVRQCATVLTDKYKGFVEDERVDVVYDGACAVVGVRTLARLAFRSAEWDPFGVEAL